MTPQQYARLKARTEQSNAVVASVKGAKLERIARGPSLEAHANQKGDPARFAVRVVSYRRRLLDEDNLAEKYHVDAVRYAGCVAEDSADQTRIAVAQIKVKSKEDEGTLIEIDYL